MNENPNKYQDDEILKQACLAFDINFKQATLIRRNKNLIYDCVDKILRISPANIRQKSDIEAEINWLIFLINNKLPVVNIIQSVSNDNFIQLGNTDNLFTVVCFNKIVGNPISKKYWNNEHFERLGKITGLLHRVGNEYKQKETIVYKDWDTILEFNSYQHLPEDKRELPQLHHNVVNQINQLPKNKNNYGLIHYDIHHGNYFSTKQNKELVLFDFEMTCKSWFINDISTVLYYANHFPKEINTEQFESNFMTYFWKGYEQEHKINALEKNWIPKFLLYRDLMIYGFISKIWKEKKLVKNEINYLERIQTSIRFRRKKQGI